MLTSDDERQTLVEKRLGALENGMGEVRRRLDVNDERMGKVEERQEEQEGVLEEMKNGVKVIRALIIENDRGWNVAKALGVLCVVLMGFGVIWVLLTN